MATIKARILEARAASRRMAVFAEKRLNKIKPVHADCVGHTVPNRYVFGYGMDARHIWRNLGAIYAPNG